MERSCFEGKIIVAEKKCEKFVLFRFKNSKSLISSLETVLEGPQDGSSHRPRTNWCIRGGGTLIKSSYLLSSSLLFPSLLFPSLLFSSSSSSSSSSLRHLSINFPSFESIWAQAQEFPPPLDPCRLQSCKEWVQVPPPLGLREDPVILRAIHVKWASGFFIMIVTFCHILSTLFYYTGTIGRQIH